MAEFKFACYRCGQHLACDESLSGTQIQCPVCQALLLVPFFRASPAEYSAPSGVQAAATATSSRRWRPKLFIDLALALAAVGASIWILLVDARKREEHRVLTSLGAIYDQMTSYQDKCFMTQEVEVEGRKKLFELSASLAVQKPDKLNLRVKSEQGEVQVVCDGQKTWTYASIFENQYISQEADKLPAVFGNLVNHSWLGLQGVLDYYHLVLGGDAQKQFRSTKNLKLASRDWFNGKRAYVTSWEFQPSPFRLFVKAWIDQENGLILKMVEEFTVVASELAKLGPYTVVNTNLLKVTTAPSGVRRNEPIREDQFVFHAPAASKAVEHFQLTSLLARRANPPFPEPVLHRLIPPRSRQAKSGMIDLTKHYNVPLVAPWHSGPVGNDLSQLPAGIQKFAGVDFDVRGFVQLSGGEVVVEYPEEVTGIKVRVKCPRLYFLHAAVQHLVKPGTKIGAYWVKYADGQRLEIPIVYGQDVVDWWNFDAKLPIHSVVAWTGQNAASRNQGRLIRVFCSTWTNPLPEIQIDAIDFISSLVDSAPFLIAITADHQDGQKLAHSPRFPPARPIRLGFDPDRVSVLDEIFASDFNTTKLQVFEPMYEMPF